MRILIAEDDPKHLKSLVHIFELNHYAVDGAENGFNFCFLKKNLLTFQQVCAIIQKLLLKSQQVESLWSGAPDRKKQGVLYE